MRFIFLHPYLQYPWGLLHDRKREQLAIHQLNLHPVFDFLDEELLQPFLSNVALEKSARVLANEAVL